MIRMITGTVAIVFAFGGTSATAKTHDPHFELKLEHIAAIHLPTGCNSMVEYNDGAFIQAFITDPLCLPYGVTKRVIPSNEQDFFARDPEEAAVKDP